MNKTSSRQCQQCAAPLPADAPEGLCPRCLMAQIIEPTQDGENATHAPPLRPDEIAPHFPQLEILECLGRGGMGVVYKARQKSLNRLVALKLLAPERADDLQFAARFEKEAHALAALNHPNIVAVHDFGLAGGFYFLLMEFVDGVNLRQLLQTKRLTPKEALSIVPPVCDALQCAHDHGIVHRDIKPENLLIDKAGVVKIADFGIAKMYGGHQYGSHLAPRDEPCAVADTQTAGTSNLHPSGGSTEHHSLSEVAAFGTPDYAAPEQHGRSITTDHRADIYSLGVVLYEMLTGERPQENIVPPSKRVQVDVRIDEIVLRALERTPELRFATASEFRTQVEAATREVSTGRSDAGHPLFLRSGGSLRLCWPGVLELCGTLGAVVLGLNLVIALGMWLLTRQPWPMFKPQELPWVLVLVVVCLVMRLAARKMKASSTGAEFRTQMEAVNGHSASSTTRAVFPFRRTTAALTVTAFHALFIPMFLTLDFCFPVRNPGILTLGLMMLATPFILLGFLKWCARVGASTSAEDRRQSRQTLLVAAWVAGVLAAVVLPLAVFFVTGFLSERGTWNPSLDEGVIVLLTWIAMLALPWAAAALFRAARGLKEGAQHNPPGTANPWPRRIFILLAVLLLGPVFVVIGILIPSYQRVGIAAEQARAANLAKHLAIFAKSLHDMDDAGLRKQVESGERNLEHAMRTYGENHPKTHEAREELRMIQAESQRRVNPENPAKTEELNDSPLTSDIGSNDNTPEAIAKAQQFGVAAAAKDIAAENFRILAYGLAKVSEADIDEETGYRLQSVAGTILSSAVQAECDAYNFAMRDHFQKHVRRKRPVEENVATKPGSYDLPQDVKLVITETFPQKADTGPVIDAKLLWPGYRTKPSESHDLRVSEGLPDAIAWSADGSILWVTCSAKLGSGKDERVRHYLRIITVSSPGEVDEELKDFDEVDATTASRPCATCFHPNQPPPCKAP